MVAIVSGGTLGLGANPVNLDNTAFGGAIAGNDGAGVYVNASSGNLVVEQRDEFLAGLGVGSSLVRTYNSQGELGADGDNGDGWRMGVAKTLSEPVGGANQPGSTLTRTDGDGGVALYKYDEASGLYITTDGSGAYDTIALGHAGEALWTDGTTGTTEKYDVQNRLVSIANQDGNVTSLAYDAQGMVSSVTQPGGNVTYLNYNGTQLTQVRTVSDGQSEVRSRYTYDTAGRLSQVSIDLSPEDSSIDDGNVYVTSYSYDGDSTRLANMTQSDGSSLSFTYTATDGRYQIASVTNALGQATLFGYDGTGSSNITDPIGAVTTLTFDAAGQLLQTLRPVVDGVRIANSYSYDANGNLVGMVDGNGQSTAMEYDARGNLTRSTDPLGVTTTRTYDEHNRLLSEVTGNSGNTTSIHYAYDAKGNLRFTVDGNGVVVERRYNSSGSMVEQLKYQARDTADAGLAGDIPLDQNTMAAWAAAQETSTIERSAYTYDFRGQLATASTFTSDAHGVVTESVARYVYDQRGMLISTVDAQAGTITGTSQTSYAYDGLGRVLGMTDALGNHTAYQYNDAQHTTTTTFANGLASTQVADAAGRVISVTSSDAASNSVLATTQKRYDADGRLVASMDANGLQTRYFYDDAGHQTGTVNAAGQVTKFFYDANDNVVRTVQYSQAVDPAVLATATNFASLLPATSASDRITRQVFDADNRLIASVDALGFVTMHTYDSNGRLTANVAYATALDADILTGGVSIANVTPTASSLDRTVRYFYDNAGHAVGQLDAAGFLTVKHYDGAGNLIEQIAYATASDPALVANGTMDQLVPDGTGAIHQHWFYDGQGRQIGSIDGEGYLTEMGYDAHGNLASVVQYATRTTVTGPTLDAVRPVSDSADERQVFEYDGLHRRTAIVGIDGTRTINTYDSVGETVSTTVAADTLTARTTLRQYDTQGRVTADLSPRGAILLSGNPAADALVWAQYGTSYSYDAGGRLTSARAPGGDSTRYFYDALGRITQTVNALGEVQENTYDAFGQVVSTKTYATRLNITGLRGGDNAMLTAALANIADPHADTITKAAYDARGEVTNLTDGLGQSTTRVYDAFGELVAQTTGANRDASTPDTTEGDNGTADITTGPSTTTFAYNKRGQLTTSVDASGVFDLTTRVVYDAFGRETSRVDARGNTSYTEYDRDGRVVVLRDRLNASTSTTYDAFGRVLTQTDGNGNATQYTYDDEHRSFIVKTADGVTTSVAKNAEGQVISVRDGAGAEIHYAYDADGNLVSTTDALGHTVTGEYDAADHLVANVDANGMRTEYRYDAANRLLSQVVDTTGLSLTTTYQYDTRGETIAVTDASGIVTTTSYDADGQILRTVQDAGGLEVLTQFSYDAHGHVLSVTRGGANDLQEITNYSYDAAGRLIEKVVDPDTLGLTTKYTYDENGNLVDVTDPAGFNNFYTYDANGRMLSQSNDNGDTTTYAYDANGNRTGTTNPSGNTVITSYDSQNRVVAQTDADGNTIHYSYDAAGRQISSTDALGAVTSYSYDVAGRLTGKVDPLGNAVTYAYDAAGNRTSVSDAFGVTSSTYDSANRLMAVTDALGNTTRYTLDTLGRRIAVTDSLGGIVTTVYDGAGRVAQVTNATGGTTSYSYDGNGNVVSVTDANGNVSQLSYNGAGELISQTDAAGNTTSYDYDPDGNRNWMMDANGNSTFYSHDANGRLVEQSTYVDGAYVTVEYSYDAAGRLSSKTDGNGAQTFYAYDGAGQLVAMTDGTGAVTTYAYDKAGNRVTSTDPDGNVTAYAYDAIHQLVSRTDALGHIAQYAYDARGRRISETDENGNVTSWTYDADDRMLTQTDATGNSEQYRYDAVGNRIAMIDRLGHETQYHYDAAARLVRTDGELGASESYAYDAAGNMVSTTNMNGATTTRAYDVTNRLVGVTDALGNHTSYTYDAVGNRIGATDGNGNRSNWSYDEMNRLTSLNVSDEYGNPVLMKSYAYDGVGNVVQTIDGYPEPMYNYGYDDDGNLVSETMVGYYNSKNTTFDAMGRVTATYIGGVLSANFTYDGAGNLTQKTIYFSGSNDDVGSGTTTYNYDALNRLVSTVDSLGNKQLISYDAVGNALTRTDGNGNVTSYTYDALNRVVRTVDAMGGVATTQYDDNGNVISSTDRTGLTTTKTYDAAGRLISNVDPLGLRTTYSYDAVGNIVAVTDGAGQTTLSMYDLANNLISTRDALGNLVTFAYDAAGNRIQRVGARGEVSTFTYDAAGHLTSASTDVSSTSYTYDLSGYRQQITQAGGQWQGSDEMFGLVTSETYVAGQPKYETFSYDVQGNRTTSGPIAQLDGGYGQNPLTYYYYDTENRLVGVRDPNGGYTTIEYDGAGNRTAVIDGNGNRTTYVYDALNRLVSTIDPTGHADTVSYDNAGNQIAKTDRNGNTTTYEYDLDNRLTAVVAPDGQRTQYVLDNAGRHLVETVAAGTADARTQSYVYDAVGHVVTMTAPDGTVTSYQYDASGNAISRIVTDTNGLQNVTRYAYDVANRLVSTITDAEGLAITEQVVWNANGQIGQKIDGAGRVKVYQYDESGNLVGITSANGFTSFLSQYYDDSGNLVSSATPNDVRHVNGYDAAGHVSSVSTNTGNYYDAETDQTSYDGATTYSYDGAGNMVMSVDPQGRVTNNYYDSNNRLVAQLDGDDVLHEFDYDPVGNKIAERLYMDRQPNAHIGDVRPQGTGEVRVTTFTYDNKNRLVQTTYPTVSTTQLAIVNGVPHSSTVTVTPTATHRYDTFGNLVETVALDGKRTISYYDIDNRVIAQVDPQGVLTQYSYDGTGHLTETRVFATALNNANVIPGNVPAAPSGLVTVTSSTFDSVGRQVSQRIAGVTLSAPGVDASVISAAAAVASGAEVTMNVYDASGNLIQQIRAPGLPEQQNSYFYYNANGNMTGSIDAQRALTLYSYDYGSNALMGTITYANPVDSSVNLATLGSTYAALISVAGSSEDSKGVIYQRDYANQITSETRSPYGLTTWVDEDHDVLSINAGEATQDKFYGYDAAGRRTSTYEGRGHFTTTSYDAAGRVTAVHENGVVSRQIYDAAGNVVIAYSGELNTPAGVATKIQPTLDGGVKVTYNLPGPGMSSYVVWDTVSHDIGADNNLSAYANQTREVSAGTAMNGSATIAGASGVLFYRVVTVDAAGNKSYSEEQSVNAVSPLQDVQISRIDSIIIQVRMKLADGLTDPVLVTGQYGWPYSHSMTLDSDGYYEVQFIDDRDPSAFWYQFTWTNADGSQASSSRQQPATPGGQFGDTVVTTETPFNGGVTAQMAVSMPPDTANAYTLVTARWRLAGSNGSYATAVSASGSSANLAIGGPGDLKVGQSYEVLISGIDSEGNATVINSFIYKPTGVANAHTTSTMLVLPSSSVGENQLVIVNGQPVASTEVEGSSLTSLQNSSNAGLAFYKTEKATTQHTTTLTANAAHTKVTVKTTLSADEASKIGDGLHISWRKSGTATGDGTTFANDQLMTQDATGYGFSATGLSVPAKGIDYKIWYTDAEGREVIVDWSAISAGASSSRTTQSDIVLASQMGGSIANGKVTLSGDRMGEVDVADFNSGASLHATDTGLIGGSIMTSALAQGYGRTSQYDALNHLIGTTGDDGVWTKYGVDLDGNVLTTSRQDVENGLTQTAYAEYDIEGRVTAQYGPAFTSADGSLQRTVTTTTYDVFGHATSTTDALGNISTVKYDAQGRVLQQTDALGNSKRYSYDTLGNLLNVTDENGSVTQYYYDGAGNRISEIDAGGMHQSWQYDVFGRVVADIDGNGNRVEIAYDSLDRVVQHGSTTFYYDDTYHTTQQGDTSVDMGMGTTTSYDLDGRVIGTSALNNASNNGYSTVSSSRSYDTYGNLTSETDEEGRTTRSVYGPNSRLLSKIDPDGNIVSYTYDSLGRRSTETGSGRNIVYSYDEAGHLSQIADLATGTTTRYSYDAAGRQVHESVSGAVDQFGQSHGREIDTVYDALGRVAAWSDSVTGTQESYTYDAAGNRIRVQGSGPGTTVDHGTDFDGAGHVIALRENGVVVSTYTYDAAGNRVTATSGGVTTTYTYDNAHRVLNATTPDSLVEWQYDYRGNITLYRESKNGVVRKTTTNQYDNVGHNTSSKTETVADDGKVSGQQTTNTFDDSGRLLNVKLHTYGSADKTYYYLYTYAGDGRELSVRAYGDAKGNATFTYDVDNNLVKVNQGQGDGQTRSEVSTYVYDNNGQILAKYHDDGTATIQDHLDYVYVQGNPAATTGTSIAAGGVTTILDTENYALFQNIDSSFPASSAVPYTVRAGETLQSIADLVYGDRSLWYLIADANGLTGSETLATGTVLTVPPRSQTGAIDGNTHTVYSQDDVVGSTLPNLKSPPPSGHGCSGLLQVLVVVVAVVVTVYTAGVAAGAFAPSLEAGSIAAEGATAAQTWNAGLAIITGDAEFSTATVAAAGVGGAAGSIASQGLAIATGLQDSFSWRGVAQGFVGAAVTAGVGAYAQTTVVVPGITTDALPGASLLNDTGFYGRAALTNAATQGLSVATHLQDSFSWRSVGATAIAAGVGDQVRNAFGAVKMPGLLDVVQGSVSADEYAASILRQTAIGTTSAVVQQKLSTGRINLSNAAMGAFSSSLESKSNEPSTLAQAAVASDAFGNAFGNSLAAGPNQPRDPWKALDNLGSELASNERFAANTPTTNATDFVGSDALPVRTDPTNLDGTPISSTVVTGHKMSLWEKVESYVDDAGNAIARLFASSNGSPGSGLSSDQVQAIVAAGQNPDAVGNDFGAGSSSNYPAALNPDDWNPPLERKTSLIELAQENKGIVEGLSDAKGWRNIYKATSNALANSSIGGPGTTPLTADERTAALNTAKSVLGFVGKETEPMLMFGLPELSIEGGKIGASSTVEASKVAYRPVSTSSSSILSSEGLARAGQARADLYQAWKADNAAAYSSIEEQVAGYRNLVSGESPWPEGFTPVNETIPQGARVRMALSPGQPLTSPGGFGTFDPIPSELYVRNELAVKYGWKNDIGGVVEYEVTQPLPVRSGPVGPQIDLGVNRYLPGGGSQVNFNIPRTQSRMDYLNVIGFTPFK